MSSCRAGRASGNCCASRASSKPAAGPGLGWRRRSICSGGGSPMPLERVRRRWLTLDRWQRFAIIAWVLALLILGGKAVVRPHSNSVYPIFADAGRHWREGSDLYELPPTGDEFRYSPLVAALFVPPGLLPDGA